MKLNEEQIKRYLDCFKYELSEESLRKDWRYDSKNGFTTIGNPVQMKLVNLVNGDGEWLRIDYKYLTPEQAEQLFVYDKITNEEIKNAYKEYDEMFEENELPPYNAAYMYFEAGVRFAEKKLGLV